MSGLCVMGTYNVQGAKVMATKTTHCGRLVLVSTSLLLTVQKNATTVMYNDTPI